MLVAGEGGWEVGAANGTVDGCEVLSQHMLSDAVGVADIGGPGARVVALGVVLVKRARQRVW